jgi:hypothetical protein
MSRQVQERTFDEAVQWLRDHSFDILEAPGTKKRVFIKKYGVSAAIEKADEPNNEDGVKVFARPGYLINGEISKLVDRGYQKFLMTTKSEVPATSDHLKAVHDFTEELKEATGMSSLYNESLGTVSDSYHYDRVKDRDQAEPARPKRPWKEAPAPAPAAKPTGKKRA